MDIVERACLAMSHPEKTSLRRGAVLRFLGDRGVLGVALPVSRAAQPRGRPLSAPRERRGDGPTQRHDAPRTRCVSAQLPSVPSALHPRVLMSINV